MYKNFLEFKHPKSSL